MQNSRQSSAPSSRQNSPSPIDTQYGILQPCRPTKTINKEKQPEEGEPFTPRQVLPQLSRTPSPQNNDKNPSLAIDIVVRKKKMSRKLSKHSLLGDSSHVMPSIDT